MELLSIKDAAERLQGASPGLYADFLAATRQHWAAAQAYACAGAVVVKTAGYSSDPAEVVWYICDTGGSQVKTALRAVRQVAGQAGVSLFYMGTCRGQHSLLFSRMGEAYADTGIRALQAGDAAQLTALTDVPRRDWNPAARPIAQSIQKNFAQSLCDTNRQLLGIFDGAALAGAVSIARAENAALITISNVFVPAAYRGRGYAARLVRAATAVEPSARYVYSCGSGNTASIATAKSAGYHLAGAFFYRVTLGCRWLRPSKKTE